MIIIIIIMIGIICKTNIIIVNYYQNHNTLAPIPVVQYNKLVVIGIFSYNYYYEC